MVRQGDLPNPRASASAPRLPGTDARPFCCVYSYTDNNEIVGAECVELDDTFDESDCVELVNNPLDPAAPQRQRGVVAECCRDCQLIARKLMITRCGNRTFLAGAGRFLPYTSPVESPEDCCCGDVPRCVQVPGCNQVDCYPEPPDSGDKCDGRCLTMEYDDEGREIVEDRGILCATKVQCCAEDNSSCMDRCYDSADAGVVPEPVIMGATNQWTPMACTTDCGVCCTHVYNTDPGSPTYRQSIMRLGVTSLTREECEATEYDPNTLGPVLDPVPLGPVGDWVENTDDTNVCNPPCCLDQQFGDALEANCHYTDQLFCDPCVGRCIDVTAENDPGMCPRQRCATKQECCGDGGEKCQEGLCGEGEPALYRWEPIGCVENAADLCGTCCKNEYAVNGQIAGIVCDPGTTTKEQCERSVTIELPPPDDPDAVPPPPLNVQYGTWAPFETCRVCADLVPCCREIECPDGNRADCVDVLPADCDFCLGRCTELETGEQSCETKQDCCDNDNFKCGICGVDPTHSWEPGCADATKCGVCCKLTINPNTGDVIAATCDDSITAEQCAAIQAANPNQRGEWRPFETCDTVECLTKPCCGEGCGGAIECIQIPYEDDCNPCHGRCQPFDGADYCGTKQECCGDDGSGCDPDCPEPNTWTAVCASNSTKCGVCCETVVDENTGQIVNSVCHDISYEECMENAQNQNPTSSFAWKPFETCDSVICNPKICCKSPCENVAKCSEVDYMDDCNECAGRCEELGEDDEIVSVICATRTECCGAGGEKCAQVCPTITPTHNWTQCTAKNCLTCNTIFPSNYFQQQAINRGGGIPPIPAGCKCTATQCQTTVARGVGKPNFSTYGLSTANLKWKPCYPALLNASGKQWNIVTEVQHYNQYQDVFFGQPLSSLCEGKWQECEKWKVRFRVLVCENDELVDVTADVLTDEPLTLTARKNFQSYTFTTSTPHYNYEYCRKISGGLSRDNPAGSTGSVWLEDGPCTDCTVGDYLPFPAALPFSAKPASMLDADGLMDNPLP